MYGGSTTAAAAGAGAATLPFTGTNLLWAFLASFAMIALGGSLRRIAPKFKRIKD